MSVPLYSFEEIKAKYIELGKKPISGISNSSTECHCVMPIIDKLVGYSYFTSDLGFSKHTLWEAIGYEGFDLGFLNKRKVKFADPEAQTVSDHYHQIGKQCRKWANELAKEDNKYSDKLTFL